MPPETMRKPSAARAAASALRVHDDIGGVLAEGRLPGLEERDRLRRDHVHERPALEPREHRLVDRGRVLLAAQDRSRPRAAQGLVRREGHDVGVRHRRRVCTTGDQPRDVGRVDEQQRVDLVGDRAERLEVDDARVRGGPRDDQARPLAHCEVADLVVVEHLGLVVDAVRHEVVHAAAEVHGRTVGEVPTLVEPHSHHLVARLEQRHERGLVRVGARVRLHVDVLGTEQRAALAPGPGSPPRRRSRFPP